MTSETDRKTWMSILATAPAARLNSAWADLGCDPEFTWLRQPEIGGVMVRGRMGGTGGPFNLGEMTVTRCSLRLSCGALGHGYVPGRDKSKARIAALCDALLQTAEAGAVRARVLDPLAEEADATRATRAGKAAATKVDFFTMVRGED
ncbi:MAG: phosphonate C-P lyase system protein PhnG [Pseudomonadota bacterium]